MENILSLQEGVSLMTLSPPYEFVHLYKGIEFEIFKQFRAIEIILILIVLVILYRDFKKADSKVLQNSKVNNNPSLQEASNNSLENYSSHAEDTSRLCGELTFNFCVTLEIRESRESDNSNDKYKCHNQKSADKQQPVYQDLCIRYKVKKDSDLGERNDQGDNIHEKDIAGKSTKPGDQTVIYEHEITTSICSRIKIKDFECQVSLLKVASHHPPEINKIPWRQMNREWWRLHTFSKYPRNSPCSPILLARQGFVYIGTGNMDDDTVICVFCLSAAKDLGIDTNIEELHHSLNPSCPMVLGQDCRNIKIREYDGEQVSNILSVLKGANKTRSSTKKSRQFETQILPPLQVDSTNESPQSGNPATASSSNDTASDQVRAASSVSQVNNNTVTSSAFRQASEDNAPYEVVTNRAQSLSLGSTTASSGRSSSRTYETQEIATPSAAIATPDAVPSPAPASATPASAKANPDRSLPRQEGDGAHHNQSRSSESSRPTAHCSNPNPQPQTNRPQEARSNSSNSHSPPENSSSAPLPQTASDGSDSPPTTTTSYDKLGIITARPKRPEYAVEITRLNSFEGWPQDHHIKFEDLAKAGYFYTGYSDCARCFHCGGGLRNWEVGDDVWVEHARWFPKCAFMRQIMGQPFIDVVQDLNKEKEIIPYEDVIAEMKYRGLKQAIPKEIKEKSVDLERDAAVKAIIASGFTMDDTVMAAEKLREAGQTLSADVIYEELERRNVQRKTAAVKPDDDTQSISKGGNQMKDQETFESLRGENSQLRQQSQCKICMDKEVSVVFLPCGHFISCNDCSFALKSCPVCRDTIKGVVRASLK